MEKTVLLVDDDLVLRDVVQDVLEAEGYDVVPASDGHQALEFLRTSEGSANAPALMILDLQMPLLNGWQVLAAMKRDPALKVRTIVMSATGPEPRDGVEKYLQKPLDLVELLETVHKRC
jgi:two-component system chemotaxis response regulator CheY